MVPDRVQVTPLRGVQVTPLRGRLLESWGWLAHGFGTRGDGYWTPPEQTARLRQVHGATVAAVDGPGDHGEGDALLTSTPGVWLEIRTADCVPLLIVDPVRRTVAAIHAGWRGTAARITGATVEELRDRWGANPADLVAVIGPAIGVCCFEVGDEVAARFDGNVDRTYPKAHVDLAGANREQLIASGLRPDHIESMGLCTACDAARFHSFRRDRGDGRLVTAIAIRL